MQLDDETVALRAFARWYVSQFYHEQSGTVNILRVILRRLGGEQVWSKIWPVPMAPRKGCLSLQERGNRKRKRPGEREAIYFTLLKAEARKLLQMLKFKFHNLKIRRKTKERKADPQIKRS